MKDLQAREDYSDEQRRLENYKVWITSEGEEIEVSFLAVRRKGDEEAKGGNFTYARSTTYFVSAKTSQIVRVQGSK